jgi:hypothetical protein
MTWLGLPKGCILQPLDVEDDFRAGVRYGDDRASLPVFSTPATHLFAGLKQLRRA